MNRNFEEILNEIVNQRKSKRKFLKQFLEENKTLIEEKLKEGVKKRDIYRALLTYLEENKLEDLKPSYKTFLEVFNQVIKQSGKQLSTQRLRKLNPDNILP